MTTTNFSLPQATAVPGVREEVGMGSIYREALARTDEIIGKVQGWFKEYNNGEGVEASEQVAGRQTVGGPIVFVRRCRTRYGYDVELVWGCGCGAMLRAMEERIGRRMAAFLAADRGAPIDIAGELAGRRIRDVFPEEFDTRKPGLLLATLRAIKDLKSEQILQRGAAVTRSLERTPDARPPKGDEGDRDYRILLDKANEACRAEGSDPERWIALVMDAVEDGLSRSQGMLAALDSGVRTGIDGVVARDERVNKEHIAVATAEPGRSDAARRINNERDRAERPKVSVAPALIPARHDGQGLTEEIPQFDGRVMD